MTAQGNIYGINGPIIYLKGDSGFQMNEMVYVGTAGWWVRSSDLPLNGPPSRYTKRPPA